MLLFAKALDAFLESGELKEVSLDCESEMPETFESGQSLISFIKAVRNSTLRLIAKILIKRDFELSKFFCRMN